MYRDEHAPTSYGEFAVFTSFLLQTLKFS
jgi:hypothetical protein